MKSKMTNQTPDLPEEQVIEEKIKYLDRYVKQVVDSGKKQDDGNMAIDPVGLAVLAYWWEDFKKVYASEIRAIERATMERVIEKFDFFFAGYTYMTEDNYNDLKSELLGKGDKIKKEGTGE